MRLVVALCLLCSVSFGLTAPAFRGELLGGGRVSLEEKLKPGRALLVCFWATWCTPCIEELKTVSEKLKADPSIPLDVLTVNVDTSETASDVKPTVALYGFPFPVILDPKHEIFGKYQTDKTLPYSVLVDAKSNILAPFSGYQETMMNRVKEAISAPAPAAATTQKKG